VSEFSPALDYLLGWEDPKREYADVPDNKGRVIAGINSLGYPDVYARIAAMAQADRAPAVANFYQQVFWNPLMLGQLDSQDVANRMLDMAVNSNTREAVLLLQRAVGDLQPGIGVDGVMGPKTLLAANTCDAAQLLAAYRARRVGFYQQVASVHPEDAPYLPEWTRRAEG
jgi:lysozyme family protein